MKNLATHINPHLDDICGIWLFKKYFPGWKKANVRFVNATPNSCSTYGGKPVDTDADIVHVGVCRGKYDEHKGDLGKSAAVLVWEDLKRKKHLPKDKIEQKALKLVIDYVLEGDLGLRYKKEDTAYELGTLVKWIPDSFERVECGSIFLEALLNFLESCVKLEQDWVKRKVFKTKWGNGVGLISESNGAERAYNEGYVLIVQIEPKKHYYSIRADAQSKVDLTEAYEKAVALEPKSDWYLHHSKRLLICGSSTVANKFNRSKLSLEQMIGLVKK